MIIVHCIFIFIFLRIIWIGYIGFKILCSPYQEHFKTTFMTTINMTFNLRMWTYKQFIKPYIK